MPPEDTDRPMRRDLLPLGRREGAALVEHEPLARSRIGGRSRPVRFGQVGEPTDRLTIIITGKNGSSER